MSTYMPKPGEVEIYSDGEDEMVAHATATYSIPPPEHRG